MRLALAAYSHSAHSVAHPVAIALTEAPGHWLARQNFRPADKLAYQPRSRPARSSGRGAALGRAGSEAALKPQQAPPAAF